jgi:hypothetical protein
MKNPLDTGRPCQRFATNRDLRTSTRCAQKVLEVECWPKVARPRD